VSIHAFGKVAKIYSKLHGIPSIVHGHSRFLTGGVVAQHIGKKLNSPYIITEHSNYILEHELNSFEKRIMLSMVGRTQAWVTVSDSIGKVFKEMFPKIQTNFHSIPNVIDSRFEEYISTEIQEVKDVHFTFFHLGSFDPNKNQELLIRSLSKLDVENVELRIGGKGPLEGHLKKLVAELNLGGKVVFLGQLDREEVLHEMKNCSGFLLASQYETFGAVLIEALALGKPVISTRCGGPESIITNQNGFLCNSNVADYSFAMTNMIINFARFDQRGIREDCIKRFGTKAVAKKYIKLYQSIA